MLKGLLLSFDEKGNTCGSGWINACIYLLTCHLPLTIPPSIVISLEREMSPAWIGRELNGYRSEGRFLDIGTPEAHKTAEQFFAHWTLT
jgi:NDP-sugar pyrophosphorylase family protein